MNNTRVISTLTNNNNNKLDPNYVTGFTDGEGCFYIGISPLKITQVIELNYHFK